MNEAIGFAAPRAEEMTKVLTAGAGAGITGAVEGIVIKMAPQLGALEPIFTWGTLLGVPMVSAVGALFTKGLIGDLFLGSACGGLGIVGYSLPEMLAPITGRKGLTAEQKAVLAQERAVKQLGTGNLSNAFVRAQQAARVGIEF
jgi:hypothetical protein